MKNLSLSLVSVLTALVAPVAFGSDLNVNIKAGGQATIKVAPGEAVNYTVTGELSDALNEGLAYFSLDLDFNGGALSPANTPNTNPMQNFANPLGLNNPQGFGGTVQSGKLVQVGGLQNTWNNTFAPVPNGTVIKDVAKPGSPVALVSGTLNAPLKVGTYTLMVTNLEANVIKLGETGTPFWKVASANAGSNGVLTIKVSALSSSKTSLSISQPGSTNVLSLNAGPAYANRTFLMLGSFSGTSPGLAISAGVKLPLNYDSYFQFLSITPSPPMLQNHIGLLDAQGKATSTYIMPTALRPTLVGLTVSHAYLLTPTNDFASDAASFTLTP